MKIRTSLKIALNIIIHSKIRSWLTVIGIVIGIAAIVSIISIGQGAQKTLEANLNTLSADMITINSGFSRASGASAGFHGGDFGGPSGGGESRTSQGPTPKNLTYRDVIVLKSVPNVAYVMGIVSGSVDTVSYLGKSSRGSIMGVDPAVWRDMTSTELASGRYLIQGDVNCVVIGGRIASSTFTNLQVNRQISIAGKSFKIIGILKESGGSDDSRIIMPIENAVTILANKDKKTFDSIQIKIKDISLTDDTVAQITSKLMMSHGILQASKQDFSITTLKSMQERIGSALSTMSLFLSAIAAISLIVGAIGIMNTMFTSVLERTKEIGILKALGSRNKDILMIFLFNSGIIGLVGGILGIILGVVASTLISSAAGISLGRFALSTYVSPTLVIGVFAISMFIGLVAGAIPAYRASRLRPVDALRFE